MRAGLHTVEVREAFDGQFLGIVTAKGREDPDHGVAVEPSLRVAVEDFGRRYRAKRDEWANWLRKTARQKRRVVAWGAGSKGVTFLNVLGRDAVVPYIVDLNPRKRGLFVAGSGQEIVGPEFLKEYRPDAVLVMNAIYAEEIRSILEGLGVEAEVLCV